MTEERRASGTGSINQQPNGRWAAKRVGGGSLGTFDTRAEAEHAIAEELASRSNGSKRKGKTSRPSSMVVARGIGRYLDALAEGGGVPTSVGLGQLAGFPARTRDPEVIAKAIEVMRGELPNMTAIGRLKRSQRIIELTREMQWLEEGGSDTDEAFFVAYAAQWASESGVSYEAFRALGVTPAVLRKAGIERTRLADL